jgi:pyruvate,water dikinase
MRDLLATRPPEEAWAAMQRRPAAAPFVAGLERLMETYGCRTEAPIPLPSTRPWMDRPVHVLRVLARFASAPPGEQTHADSWRSFARGYRRVIQAAQARGGRRLSALFRFLVRRNRALWYERDWLILTYEQAVAPVRGVMREIGRRLASRGVLRCWNDVRFLTLEEAARGLRGRDLTAIRALAEKRRAARSTSVRAWSAAIRAVAPAARSGVAVRGTGASPGSAVGRAHVLLSDRDLEGFPAGAVLVCRATGPAWTPLFGLAAAVVTDVGGPLSHAAIVAREYGIPAVIGTGNGTAVLTAGWLYTVDGDRGEVLLAPSLPSGIPTREAAPRDRGNR